MNLKLLKALKSKASEILESNTRLHDYGHAIEVLGNVQKLIKASGNKLDIDILYTAALFQMFQTSKAARPRIKKLPK
jgi:5-methylcytosine-specific restriction endonuclease McrBC regulatory subunit McrC